MASKNSKYHHSGLHVNVYLIITSKIAFKDLILVDSFSILIVNSGSFSIQINNRKIDLSANEMIVISKRVSCEILFMSELLQICQVSFTSEFAFKNSIRWPHIGYFEFFITQSSTKLFLKIKDVELLIGLFKLLNSKAELPRKHIFKKETLFFSFNLLLYELAGLYHRSSWTITLKHSRKEILVMEFFKILQINCRKEHSVKFYADALCVTTGYLTKMVKEIAEKTAKQFIEESIILEAKLLLQNKHLTILYISEELQFSNSSVFSNFFKRHTSLSPSVYRLTLKL